MMVHVSQKAGFLRSTPLRGTLNRAHIGPVLYILQVACSMELNMICDLQADKGPHWSRFIIVHEDLGKLKLREDGLFDFQAFRPAAMLCTSCASLSASC
jgi:hypothetical protein